MSHTEDNDADKDLDVMDVAGLLFAVARAEYEEGKLRESNGHEDYWSCRVASRSGKARELILKKFAELVAERDALKAEVGRRMMEIDKLKAEVESLAEQLDDWSD